MIEALIVNIHIQSLILGLILASVFFKFTRKDIKLNEPPFVPYRFPIIGHTWSFLTDCEKLILESQVFVRDRDFNHIEATKTQLPLHYIFTYSPDMIKNGLVMKDWFTKKIDWLTTKLYSNIKAIDMYIGDCDEPKVIRDPVKVMRDIISIPFSSECCHYDDILDIFRNLTASVSKLTVIPPLLAFIHPWLHQQFITFGWNPYSKYRETIIRRIRPVIEKRLNDRKRLGDDWVAPVSYDYKEMKTFQSPEQKL
ncbi:38629_t:CDS:2 [Gigaspora margarita]|uniref:38629_t:CDS:1 n=1 Tax=Gigaspora margarita TaxID=4874 RepID=A0ABM8W1G3_GIGMA|nr:38629_t:CDS:2 [Gigaspora margarita]